MLFFVEHELNELGICVILKKWWQRQQNIMQKWKGKLYFCNSQFGSNTKLPISGPMQLILCEHLTEIAIFMHLRKRQDTTLFIVTEMLILCSSLCPNSTSLLRRKFCYNIVDVLSQEINGTLTFNSVIKIKHFHYAQKAFIWTTFSVNNNSFRNGSKVIILKIIHHGMSVITTLFHFAVQFDYADWPEHGLLRQHS